MLLSLNIGPLDGLVVSVLTYNANFCRFESREANLNLVEKVWTVVL